MVEVLLASSNAPKNVTFQYSMQKLWRLIEFLLVGVYKPFLHHMHILILEILFQIECDFQCIHFSSLMLYKICNDEALVMMIFSLNNFSLVPNYA